MTENTKIKLIKCGSHQFGIFDQTIGQGGSAIVKKGYDKNNPKQLYAVKIINIKEQDKKELALKQLEIMQQLPNHPNLVRIEKIKVQSQNNIYIFMEYCNGGTLFDLYDKRQLIQEQINDIFCQFMRGYKVLFDNNVLHEDIKLQNILIHDDIYKISDFGLAILNNNYKYGMRRKGTLSYMPYEKLSKKDYTANTKCDIYSFGVVMYQLICRKHPYICSKKDTSTWIKDLRVANLRDNLLGKYSLRFRTFFDIVLRMVAKLENDRISFEQLWTFYLNHEQFANLRSQKIKGSIIKPQIPQKYSIIGTSQAAITTFTPQQSPEIVQLRRNLQSNRKIAQYIELIIKSSQFFRTSSQNQDQKQCQQLELILHISRVQVMKSSPIDWFTAPQSIRQICQNYQQDQKFVKQQFLDYLSQTNLKQQSKKRISQIKLLTSNQQIFEYIKKAILQIFKNRFMIVKINYPKQIQLLFYLISFIKITQNKEIEIQKIQQILKESQQDYKIKPEIEQFLKNENVMIDGDDFVQREMSQEFELLTLE